MVTWSQYVTRWTLQRKHQLFVFQVFKELSYKNSNLEFWCLFELCMKLNIFIYFQQLLRLYKIWYKFIVNIRWRHSTSRWRHNVTILRIWGWRRQNLVYHRILIYWSDSTWDMSISTDNLIKCWSAYTCNCPYRYLHTSITTWSKRHTNSEKANDSSIPYIHSVPSWLNSETTCRQSRETPWSLVLLVDSLTRV